MNIKCFFGIHDYGDYSLCNRYTSFKCSFMGPIQRVIRYNVRVRQCKCCKMVETMDENGYVIKFKESDCEI